jgi:hypothetical protein
MSRSLVPLIVAGCGGGQTPIETVLIAPLRTPCSAFAPTVCLEMTPDRKPTERVFFGIEGFTHRWGFEAEIQLEREQLELIPDGPSENLIMVELINEAERITAPFELEFPFGGGWFSGTSSPLQMHGTVVLCEAAVCSSITTAEQSGVAYTLTMELTDDDQTLRATGVL